MKKIFLLITVLAVLFFATSATAGTTVSLTWTPNTESDLAGYRIYQDGVLQPDINCLANDSSCTNWTSGDLTEGYHEWYATAFDASGNESLPSNTVSHTVDLTAPGSPGNLNITINITINP